MFGRMAGNIFEEIAKGFQYPEQKLFYDNPEFPGVTTKIEYFDYDGKIKMKVDFTLVTEEDISSGEYLDGNVGRVKSIKYTEYDKNGRAIQA